MNLRWPGLAYALLAALSVCLFAAGGHFAASALIEWQSAKQLRELNEVALRRSEVAVDYGAAALDEIATEGPMSCEAPALQAVRLHVYRRGAVKDIRAIRADGSVVCSAYSETLEFDKEWASREHMLAASDPTLRLFRVDQFFGVALGVLKQVDDSNALVAILGINGSLFDIMPDELRDHSDVVLTLNDGRTIAHSSPREQPASAAELVTVAANSDRFPLRTSIRIDPDAYAAWNREPYRPLMALALALGLAFGLLLARVAIRPDNPVAELDRALSSGEFQPYLQPVFGLDSGAIVGAEVLARWVRPDGTVLPPSRFIQLAVDSGRIDAMTWQLLSAALHELQPRMRQDKAFKLSVNIVPRHFVTAGFLDDLRRIVAEAKVSPRQIVVELTEREDFEDLEHAAALVAELRDFGFRVAIDDVGIGHNGLSHIQSLGANILKIDKFFIDSIDRDGTANAVVEMLVRLAKQLGMSVVAEGIEAEDQIAALVACGVTNGQGFVVSPPLPVGRFLEFLDRRSPGAADGPAATRATRAA